MSSKKLAIVGIFYDGYEDSWIDFLRCFNKFWGSCPYPLYIVSNEKALPEYENVHWIQAGNDAEYSKKVQKAIKEIEADYLLLMLEDFYFGTELSSDVLESVMKYIEKESIDYYCLSSMSSFTKYKSDLYDAKVPFLYKINPKGNYTLGCQAVIWKKTFLQKCIGTRNYNAWVFEGALAHSKKTHTVEFLKKCVKDTRNVLKLKHGILQQKLLPPTVDYYNTIGFPLTSKRTVMSDSQYKNYVRNAKLSTRLPIPVKRVVKKICGKNKGSAVLDKYEREIEIVIKENFGE